MPVSPALTGMALWIPTAVSFAAPEEAAILPPLACRITKRNLILPTFRHIQTPMHPSLI